MIILLVGDFAIVLPCSRRRLWRTQRIESKGRGGTPGALREIQSPIAGRLQLLCAAVQIVHSAGFERRAHGGVKSCSRVPESNNDQDEHLVRSSVFRIRVHPWRQTFGLATLLRRVDGRASARLPGSSTARSSGISMRRGSFRPSTASKRMEVLQRHRPNRRGWHAVRQFRLREHRRHGRVHPAGLFRRSKVVK